MRSDARVWCVWAQRDGAGFAHARSPPGTETRVPPVPAPRTPQRRKAAGAGCCRALMFIHAALNSPSEYILISPSNYLLKPRFAGDNQIPEKEEQHLGL